MSPAPLLLAALAASPGLDAAATELVSALTLPSVDGFDLTQDVAVAVRGEDPALARALTARLAGRLAQLGLPAPRPLPEGLVPEAAAEQARAGGAEWLLSVDLRAPAEAPLELLGSLEHVEPAGLWGPAPNRPPSLAMARVYGPGPAPTAAPPPEPPPAPDLPVRAGAPLRAATFPGPVLGLALCPTAEGPEILAVLGWDALALLKLERGRLAPVARIDLGALPAAAAPTRALVGQVVCTAVDLAFGHGRLESGYRVPLDAPGSPLEALPGLPHGVSAAGEILASPLDPGTNRLSAPVMGGAEDEAWPAGVERIWAPEHPAGWRRWVITADGDLLRPDAPDAPPLRSGVGASTRRLGEPVVLVTTAPDPAPGADAITVRVGADLAPVGPPIDVTGEVRASAIGRLFEDRTHVVLAAWRPEADATDLLLVQLEGLE